MKKNILCILIIALSFLICSCGKTQESEISLPEESISEESREESVSESESDVIPKKESKTAEVDLKNEIDNIINSNSVFVDSTPESEPERNNLPFADLVDNDTPLAELMQKNECEVGSAMTYWLMSKTYKNAYATDMNSYHPTDEIEKLIGAKIKFIRTVGDFYDSDREESAQRMYTVFKSEAAGYLYIFFNGYADGSTDLTATAYIDRIYTEDEISALSPGMTTEDAAKIISCIGIADYFTESTQRVYVLLFTVGDMYNIVIDSPTKTIMDINLHTEKIIPVEKDRAGIPEQYIMDFTILPQDYPPTT